MPSGFMKPLTESTNCGGVGGLRCYVLGSGVGCLWSMQRREAMAGARVRR